MSLDTQDTQLTNTTQQEVLKQAQQVFQQHQQELQIVANQQKQAEEQRKQSLIDALQKQIGLHLSPQLQEFLSIRYKVHQSSRGSSAKEFPIATIKLADEYDQPMAGYIIHQAVNPEGSENKPGYRIVLPNLSASNSSMRGIYQDLSGGMNHYCYQEELNALMLRLIGEWSHAIEAFKKQLRIEQQRREQEQQRQEQQRQEQRQQRELKAQEEAERQAVSDQIQALLEPILEEYSTVPWTEGTSLVW